MARNPDAPKQMEVYSIPVAEGQLDMSGTERYAWNVHSVGTIEYNNIVESYYNGFICNYSHFETIDFGSVRFEHSSWAQPLNIDYGYDEMIVIDNVCDYNYYDHCLYYVKYDWESDTYSILRSDGRNPAIVIADQIPRLGGYDVRLLVSDWYVLLTCGTETMTFSK